MTQEAQEAFEELKRYLLNPPTLVAPEPGETLQLYISATNNMVSTTIVVERDEENTIRKVQHPIYFISEVPGELKIRYYHIMKLAYALKVTVRKLVHYFQAHKVEVHTSSTLRQILMACK